MQELERAAYLYVRQSSVRQVYEHKESTKRQYALAERAVALGWPREHIITIDSDLGKSGSSAVNRDGFKKLVAEVGMGHAGIVIGIEISRSARATVLHLQEKRIQFPSVLLKGPRKGEIVWGRLLYTRGIQIIHNPRYTGTFSYGKMKYLHMPRQSWHVFIRDAHAGYILYEEGLPNLKGRHSEFPSFAQADCRKSPVNTKKFHFTTKNKNSIGR